MPDADQLARIAALEREMIANGKGRDVPVRSVMALLGDRWTTLILLVLAAGQWRHAELRRVLARLSAEKAISQRVLTMKLRLLERDGFIDRMVTADVPPRVSYGLTSLGEDLHAEARRLIAWVNQRSTEIARHRAAHERVDAD